MLAITFGLDSGFVEKQASQDFPKVSQVAIFLAMNISCLNDQHKMLSLQYYYSLKIRVGRNTGLN